MRRYVPVKIVVPNTFARFNASRIASGAEWFGSPSGASSAKSVKW